MAGQGSAGVLGGGTSRLHYLHRSTDACLPDWEVEKCRPHQSIPARID